MSEEEFEERQLTKLISDLRDINSYTDFKNGAFIYDLGHYQGLLLVNEIERLNNIINEFDKWLKSEIKRLEKIQTPNRGVKPYGQEYNNYTLLIGAYDNALDKLQELKGVDKE